MLRPPASTPFPYTTLFRSCRRPAPVSPAGWLTAPWRSAARQESRTTVRLAVPLALQRAWGKTDTAPPRFDRLAQSLRYRSEEHTSELQSHRDLVCRLLLEK